MMNVDRYGLDSRRLQVRALSEVKVGDSGVLERLDLPEDVSDHLAHLGFLPGASFEVLRRAPAGDPTVYRIDGIEVGLRNETARHILIETSADMPLVAETKKKGHR
jgi:Fe2+ transport system protein FeoA